MSVLGRRKIRAMILDEDDLRDIECRRKRARQERLLAAVTLLPAIFNVMASRKALYLVGMHLVKQLYTVIYLKHVCLIPGKE